MQKYELVLLLNTAVPENDRKKFLSDLEATFKVVDKDDMGLKDISFQTKEGNTRAYFISYCLSLDSSATEEVKKYFLYNTNVVRYELFKMTPTQEFFHFDKLQESFTKELEDMKDKRFGKKVTFFTKKENEKYINWKSLSILKYYLTRFGDIKPREYTDNPLRVQKKLRQEIIRARTLGILNFINK